MSVTISGIPIVDLPDLGAVTDSTSVVAEHAGSGRVSAPSMRTYFQTGIAHTSQLTALSASSYGAVGNGTTDDTVALQAAIDAAIAAAMPLFIPPGRYLISAALSIKKGVHIFGVTPPPIEPYFGTFALGGAGTWISINNTMHPAFLLQAEGTPSNTNMCSGVEIDHLGFIYTHVAGGAGWTPRAYPPTICWNSAIDVEIHHCIFLNPNIALSPLQVAGVTQQGWGQFWIHHNRGQPLSRAAIIDANTDTVRFDSNHWWPYWTESDANVMAWVQANGTVYQIGDVDSLLLSNEFCWGYNIGVSVATAVGGAQGVMFSQCGFDQCKMMLYINDAFTAGHWLSFTGCWTQGYAGDTSSAILIAGTGSNASVLLTNCNIRMKDYNGVAITSTGANNRVALANCRVGYWDQANNGSVAFNVSAGNEIYADTLLAAYSNMGGSALEGGSGIHRIEQSVKLLTGVLGAGTSSVTVAHGLPVVPASVGLTPTAGILPATAIWATVDATNIVVHLNANTTNAATVYIQAFYHHPVFLA